MQRTADSNGIKAAVFDFGNVLATVDRLARHSPMSAQEVQTAVFGTDLEWDSETGRYDSRRHFELINTDFRSATVIGVPC